MSARDAGHACIERGWAVMLLAVDGRGGKLPPANCAACDWRRGAQRHDREACGHLLCHGFYAATRDHERWEAMNDALPGGRLAIRTGRASRLVVLDAEASAKPGEPSGLEVLDALETWTGGIVLPTTLQARSVSGGMHVYLELPPDVTVPTAIRALPSLDIKAEGGYVGAPDGEPGGREWVDADVPVAPIGDDLLEALGRRRAKFRSSGAGGGPSGPAPSGYDYELFARDGCPGGFRDYFANDLAFRLRKDGVSPERMLVAAREHWERMAQPPDAEWFMPWEDVEYKIERVVAEVDPDVLPSWRPVIIEGGLSQEDNAPEQTSTPAVPAPMRIVGEFQPPIDSDTGNALRFTKLLGDYVRYVAETNTWYLWDGVRWHEDRTQKVVALTQLVLDDLADEMLAATNERDRLQLQTHIRRTASAAARANILRLASAETPIAASLEQFDANPYLLVVRNGTLDLRTGEVGPHRPEDLCTRLCPVDYDPDARSGMLNEFVAKFLPDVEESSYIFTALGAMIEGGNPHRLFPVIKGGTSSGKSTLVEAIATTLGEYMVPVNISVFRGNTDDKPRPDIVRALNARIIYASEAATSWELHTDQVKRMTGGDPIVVRSMNSDHMIERTPAFSPLIVTNVMPQVKGADAAVRRRLVVLPFTHSLSLEGEDPSWKAAFAADPAVRSSLLAALVRGHQRATTQRALEDQPVGVTLATTGAFGDLDHVQQFIASSVDAGQITHVGDARPIYECIRASELHSLYGAWVTEHGDAEDRRTKLGLIRFGDRLRELGWISERSDGVRWAGWLSNLWTSQGL